MCAWGERGGMEGYRALKAAGLQGGSKAPHPRPDSQPLPPPPHHPSPLIPLPSSLLPPPALFSPLFLSSSSLAVITHSHPSPLNPLPLVSSLLLSSLFPPPLLHPSLSSPTHTPHLSTLSRFFHLSCFPVSFHPLFPHPFPVSSLRLFLMLPSPILTHPS